MRVSTRLVTGSGLLVALLGGVLAYQLWLMQQLARANRDLVSRRFRATQAALDLARRLDEFDEYARKFIVTRDPAYAERVGETRAAFTRDLSELGASVSADAEISETLRLERAWRRFPLTGISPEALAGELERVDPSDVERELSGPIAELRKQVWVVAGTIQAAIEAGVASTARAADNAERLSVGVMGAALVLGAAIVFATVRSINTPLQRLAEATRRVAKGDFSQHLEGSRGDEFAQMSADFNTMVDRLGELDAMKRQFVSHVSHELKTPLVAMQETNRLLLEGTPGPLTERQRRLLTLNLQGAERLAGTIANLLDLSSAEAGAMTYSFADHDLGALAERAAADFEALAGERLVAIEVRRPAGGVTAECDAGRALQVLHNLLDNAVKVAPPESAVSLTVAAAGGDAGPRAGPRASPACVELIVADRGPGIPDAEKDAVFERFHRLRAGRRRPGGVGLGLAICREIVRAHGGAIWMADTPGGGCSAHVLIPCRQPAPREAAEQGRTA
ncbi:MAG TPA: HAMP domain-containing sensor histidine kinase [Thermoanaerobaculaceae bacterium]|nr:HAMP domain-containing sensor histidine kinase [Thermoanaerobaculaceae bacterium]